MMRYLTFVFFLSTSSLSCRTLYLLSSSFTHSLPGFDCRRSSVAFEISPDHQLPSLHPHLHVISANRASELHLVNFVCLKFIAFSSKLQCKSHPVKLLDHSLDGDVDSAKPSFPSTLFWKWRSLHRQIGLLPYTREIEGLSSAPCKYAFPT